MPNNNFKSDESFLEKLAVGAAGVNATMYSLVNLGYLPIELERGSSGYKIWKKIKIKRVRVPDILCLRSGVRFECRGKTKLEISMSHSLKDPNRAWDAGLRADDLVSFVLFEKADNTPVNWIVASPVHFIRVEDMREAFKQGLIRISKPKGVEEGSEIRVIWPCTIAKEDSIVSEINEKNIKLTYVNKPGQQRCILTRKSFSLVAQCKTGQHVKKNQIIASTVPVLFEPRCRNEVGEDFFRERLTSVSLSERYASAKALRFRGYNNSFKALYDRIVDPEEDIYVQLEASAALAAQNDKNGWDFLSNSLNSPYLTVQLETVIVLSEILDTKSESLLIKVLTDADRESEIRAGAAWGLGNFKSQKAANSLINTFNLSNKEIKVEAARALLKIAPPLVHFLEDSLKKTDVKNRDGIAWTLARLDGPDLLNLLNGNPDHNLRRWISYIAGYGKDHFTEEQISKLCKNDPEVYFAASVLWQVLSSWIYELGEY